MSQQRGEIVFHVVIFFIGKNSPGSFVTLCNVYIHSSLSHIELDPRNRLRNVCCYFLEPKPTESTGQIPGKDEQSFKRNKICRRVCAERKLSLTNQFGFDGNVKDPHLPLCMQ